jgi:opacity protein-like surface antigen
MKKIWTTAAFALLFAVPAQAQQWSFGASTGPFVFGDFVERRLRATSGGPSGSQTLVLSAATRPGLSLDVERRLADRWAMRLEGTFTRSPLTTDQRGVGSDDGVELNAGKLDVSTWMLPLVFRINPRGTFRFHILGGPALAVYRAEARENVQGAEPAFEGTQLEWGLAAGGGVAWWVSDRFAIEGNLTDVVTTSPIDRDQFPDVPGIDIPRPHNVHTTVGVRWKF